MLNDPNQTSDARRPRSVVHVGGKTFKPDGSDDVVSAPIPLPSWIEWDVDNNVFNEADKFSISFSISGLPVDRKEDWFAQQQEISVEIFAGFPDDPESFDSSQLQSLILGMADEMDFDPVSRTINLSGRDLTAKMIDSKNSDVWINKVSSDVAKALAEKYGLNAEKVVPTKAKAGKYYDEVVANIQRQRSDWDLLSCLARMENYVVYVSGHDLHFEPIPVESDDTLYVMQWQNDPFSFNGTGIKFSRSMTLSKGVQVTVKSFHQRGKTITRTYPENAGNNAQKYNYTFANLNSEQAYQEAVVLHGEITRHEVKMSASLPADNVLTTANIIQITGTDTAYDQKYYPDSVSRKMSFNGGYTMSVSAKNHSPQTKVPTT